MTLNEFVVIYYENILCSSLILCILYCPWNISQKHFIYCDICRSKRTWLQMMTMQMVSEVAVALELHNISVVHSARQTFIFYIWISNINHDEVFLFLHCTFPACHFAIAIVDGIHLKEFPFFSSTTFTKYVHRISTLYCIVWCCVPCGWKINLKLPHEFLIHHELNDSSHFLRKTIFRKKKRNCLPENHITAWKIESNNAS